MLAIVAFSLHVCLLTFYFSLFRFLTNVVILFRRVRHWIDHMMLMCR